MNNTADSAIESQQKLETEEELQHGIIELEKKLEAAKQKLQARNGSGDSTSMKKIPQAVPFARHGKSTP
jgi:hypothetical protein